jgi:hypothetical protein
MTYWVDDTFSRLSTTTPLRPEDAGIVGLLIYFYEQRVCTVQICTLSLRDEKYTYDRMHTPHTFQIWGHGT